MFFDDIIIQPHCKMLILLCFQSVNHYTSMLLSFLGVFEIHSVDWFGLVFVLPLLKNKNINYFQRMCVFCSPALWSDLSVPSPDLKATFGAFTAWVPHPQWHRYQKYHPAWQCCSQELHWIGLNGFYFISFPVPIQPHLSYRAVFSEKDSVWPWLLGAEHFLCLEGSRAHTAP